LASAARDSNEVTALDGIGERIAATLFSGDGSKPVAATSAEAPDGDATEAQVLI
jgi:hypothetical protein